jgi:hypothetical protein
MAPRSVAVPGTALDQVGRIPDWKEHIVMIMQSTSLMVADTALLGDGPEFPPGRVHEGAAWPCPKCSGVHIHYLTCPSLRLPPGHHFSADPELRAEGFVLARSARSASGPNHPDWPDPPRN